MTMDTNDWTTTPPEPPAPAGQTVLARRLALTREEEQAEEARRRGVERLKRATAAYLDLLDQQDQERRR